MTNKMKVSTKPFYWRFTCEDKDYIIQIDAKCSSGLAMTSNCGMRFINNFTICPIITEVYDCQDKAKLPVGAKQKKISNKIESLIHQEIGKYGCCCDFGEKLTALGISKEMPKFRHSMFFISDRINGRTQFGLRTTDVMQFLATHPEFGWFTWSPYVKNVVHDFNILVAGIWIPEKHYKVVIDKDVAGNNGADIPITFDVPEGARRALKDQDYPVLRTISNHTPTARNQSPDPIMWGELGKSAKNPSWKEADDSPNEAEWRKKLISLYRVIDMEIPAQLLKAA